MVIQSFQSALRGDLSSKEEIKQARNEYHNKLREGHDGEECGDLAISYQLCLFDVQVSISLCSIHASCNSFV